MTTIKTESEWDGDVPAGEKFPEPFSEAEAAAVETFLAEKPPEPINRHFTAPTLAESRAVAKELQDATREWNQREPLWRGESADARTAKLEVHKKIFHRLRLAKQRSFDIQQGLPTVPIGESMPSFYAHTNRTHGFRHKRLAELARKNPAIASLIESEN